MSQIMIVDDDQHINDMLKENLSTEGYDVIAAYSGTYAFVKRKTGSDTAGSDASGYMRRRIAAADQRDPRYRSER